MEKWYSTFFWELESRNSKGLVRKSWKQGHDSPCYFFIYSRRKNYSCSAPFLHVIQSFKEPPVDGVLPSRHLPLAPVKSTRILFISTKSFISYTRCGLCPLAQDSKLSQSSLSKPVFYFLLSVLLSRESWMTVTVSSDHETSWTPSHP